MQEIINKKIFKVGGKGSLKKYPQAKAVVVKVNNASIEVELFSCDNSIDGRMFRVKPTDFENYWPV